jgi:hypothetical protein
MSKTAKQASKVNLVGIDLMPDGSWVVEDGRKAGANNYPCSSKGAVLSKIAEFLDAMQPPKPTLNIKNDNAEVTALVTLQASICDPKGHLPTLDVRQGVAEAVENAVEFGEAGGFSHRWANDISLGAVEVQTLTVD